MDVFEEWCGDQSENGSQYSDDSNGDPTFDVLEETRLNFSNLSVERKPKNRVVKRTNEKEGEDSAATETLIPVLDEQSQNTYETVQKIIEAGQVEKLKVDQCKIYLRKHGLRLSGTKETLVQRIKEHIRIINDGGEKEYPAFSFVMNCKGDACMGDVVMFEQKVYEGGFNIASRSANGPPCGTRIVAGRIVKESYGAAKQQHTFTIEVLWSKGEKPLSPLQQLLIKGRNLYRLKTMRQRWNDEEERHRILSEKHDRGGAARLNREARIQLKEMRKSHRVARNEHENRKQESKRDMLHSISSVPEKLMEQPKLQQQDPTNAQTHQNSDQTTHSYPSTHRNVPIGPNYLQENPYKISSAQMPPQGIPQRQPLMSMNHHFRGDYYIPGQLNGFANNRRPGYYSQRCHNANHTQNVNVVPVQQQGYKQKQPCHYYIRGRCYYGDRCKFSHEFTGNDV